MGLISGDVRVRLTGLAKFKRVIDDGTDPRIRRAMSQWAVRYRAAMQERFVKFSRGGGDWLPLKYSRRRGSRDAAAILRDTSTMFGALNPSFTSSPGALEQFSSFGVLVGYGGPGSYASGGAASVADVAEFHQRGMGYLPVRQTIVSPTDQLKSAMASDLQRALRTIVADEVNG